MKGQIQMRETCPHCQSQVLFASSICPNCRNNRDSEAEFPVHSQPRVIVENRQLTKMELLFSFRGRISRMTLWLIMLPAFVVYGWLEAHRSGLLEVPDSDSVLLPLTQLACLVFAWIAFAGQAKRWHDRGWSAWMILIGFIPIIQIWAFVELVLLGSTGPNKYGEAPGTCTKRILHQ